MTEEVPRLGFVHSDRNEAYFFVEKPRGDDLDDGYWPYNAGIPYNYAVRVVWVDSGSIVYFDLERANEKYSVEEINAGAVPWLSDRTHKRYLSAGATVEEFMDFVRAAGGIPVVIPELTVAELERLGEERA